ncbi:Site-specific recombinase XerD [Propionibacterium cyclohexanicum]|uniref:Site-specific recombinase XerD n=1 Tax=Propionibacterium cyclohexanicum TaxID=64702 RepID=A0A1H9Q7X4_9ACTN|nr:tyrosine-type recombinase/integrase [Propionibacterium cyclohexanicum]SER55953.1 Site-specific recombinase XerD [Propionibacterium cyclohexanicum]
MSVNWFASPSGPSMWTDRLDAMIHCWLASRAGTVAEKTLRTDQDLLRIIPQSYLARNPRDITPADIDGLLVHFRARGLSELSVRRYRASLSQFFRWLTALGVIERTPIEKAPAELPAPPTVARPFSADELRSAWAEWSQHDPRLAQVLLVLARTGLRWSEARALTVGDFRRTANRIVVNKSMTEGTSARRFIPSLVRQVPVAEELRDSLVAMSRRREREELLFITARGCQLHRTAVLRRLDWQRTGRGRRLNDLRHTAAKLWLDEGVPATTVQQWMGHTLMIARPAERI